MDRIDLQVQVTAIENHQLLSQQEQAQPSGDSNKKIQQRVSHARQRQIDRQGKTNAQLSSVELHEVCPLNKEQRTLMDLAIDKFALSTRGFYRVLKVARTIADMGELDKPELPQYQEALSYRPTLESRKIS